jgi:hypothetical protein
MASLAIDGAWLEEATPGDPHGATGAGYEIRRLIPAAIPPCGEPDTEC